MRALELREIVQVEWVWRGVESPEPVLTLTDVYTQEHRVFFAWTSSPEQAVETFCRGIIVRDVLEDGKLQELVREEMSFHLDPSFLRTGGIPEEPLAGRWREGRT
uniref:Uncharacterized protein n=1 Tax=Chromera velia CCMP2878 TaxID=1169474 RepID=A0A0G4GKB4_9ALVE|eukprot:Cvel_22286.t1-p1 / transcript=Cvel_22286.t1 / gene=Cvel_22286 / organism=Chromera_velia_CCMP2878 / gene_product=hypothetical protein / transcript_product=hypothetical protein / location=Cvel_scaffold2176:18729-19040(+) / protein_length=104 / sequence_SO=supercontig / SO=protein_coding / is_pseudo=false